MSRGTWKPSGENVPLAERTALRLGGPARWHGVAETIGEVLGARSWAREHDVPLLILGGGSNLVVADDGFEGLALELVDRRIEVGAEEPDGRVPVRVGAGAEWDRLVEECVVLGLGGIECLSGIPGRAGAAPIQNIGAYGQEIAETLIRIEALDLENGELRSLGPEECRFGYRTSRFRHQEAGRWVILEVELELRRTATGTARYPELRRRLELDEGEEAVLATVRETVLALRRSKSMVLDHRDRESRSVGSFFVNPVVSQARSRMADEAAARAGMGREMPRWPSPDGRVKLSAAWLIEAAGFRRGDGSNGVGISERHALALVHRGGGTTSALVEWAARIRGKVRRRFGVTLEPEPVFVGFGRPGSGPRGLGTPGREVLDEVQRQLPGEETR